MPGRVVDAQRHLVPVGAHEDELDERRQQGDDDEVEGRCRRWASHHSPAPHAMPIAAVSQMVAAVVRPRIAPCRVRMMPAPRKPMPETIWEATREGS